MKNINEKYLWNSSTLEKITGGKSSGYWECQGIEIDSRKVKLFQSLLKKPKKSEIHLHSLTLFYEAFLLVSGKYTADFIRDTTHTVHVDKNVSELILDDQVYPVAVSYTHLRAHETLRYRGLRVGG